jgi:serine/threonine protein phosphatase 1
MSLFIIGDVHGCFYTYMKLLDHWEPKTETLIQLGDLVDRGTQAPLTLRLAFEIKKTFKKSVTFLKGNHEEMMIKYFQNNYKELNWLHNGGKETLAQFEGKKEELNLYVRWVKTLPLYWENNHVFVSHAGVSGIGESFEPDNPYGVLWNRHPLKNLGKLQVIGHTPRENGQPEYSPESNSWNIDTGAYGGICLTGIKLKNDGTFLETISIPTDPMDLI